MLIAKLSSANGAASFMEVVRTCARVQFDAREGWVLVAKPLHVRPRWRTLEWLYLGAVRFEWVKDFRFETTADV